MVRRGRLALLPVFLLVPAFLLWPLPVVGLLLAALVSTWGGRRWAPVLALVLLADAALLAPFPWPLPGFAPPGLGLGPALAGEGAVVDLPWSSPGDPLWGAWRNASALFQLEHGHPIAGGVMLLGPPVAEDAQVWVFGLDPPTR